MKFLKLSIIIIVVSAVFLNSCTSEDDGIYFEQLENENTLHSSIEMQQMCFEKVKGIMYFGFVVNKLKSILKYGFNYFEILIALRLANYDN